MHLMSFWNANTRAAKSQSGDRRLEEIYVPWGEDRVEDGDTVHVVAVHDGEMLYVAGGVVDEVTSLGTRDRRVSAKFAGSAPEITSQSVDPTGACRLA